MLRHVSVAACLLLIAALVAMGCGSDTADQAAAPEPTAEATAVPTTDTTTATTVATATTTTTELPAPTPAPTTQPVAWTHYGDVEVSDNKRVVSIDVNPDGTTWALIATDTDEFTARYDVVRFDGNEWVRFDGLELAEERPWFGFYGILDPELAAGPDGTAWLFETRDIVEDSATLNIVGDLWHFDGEAWVLVESATEFFGEVDVGGDGVLWVASPFQDVPGSVRETLSFDGEQWASYPSPPGRDQLLHSDADGQVWVFTETGLQKLKGGDWTFIEWMQPADDGDGWFSAAQVVAHDGTMWAILARGTGYDDAEFLTEIFDGEAWTLWPADTSVEGWTEATATAARGPQLLTALGAEHLFVASDMRIVWFDVAGVAHVIPVDDGAALGAITALAADTEGTIWIGKGGGLTRFNPDFYEPAT